MRKLASTFLFLAAAAQAAVGFTVVRDIPYAPDNGDFGLGNLYLPSASAIPSTEPPPVILTIHGGGWSSLDRASLAGIAEFFCRDLGFAAFNIEYRLASEENRWPACGDDCVAAANWLFSSAFRDLAGFSPEKIWICGASSGGHLALWTLVNLPPEKVAGAVSISAIGDPVPDFRAHGNRYTTLFGTVSDEATLAAMDPCTRIRPGMAPLLCTHADTDAVVPIASHRAFADAYRAAGNPCVFFEYPHDAEANAGGHFIWRPNSSPHRLLSLLERRISAFFSTFRTSQDAGIGRAYATYAAALAADSATFPAIASDISPNPHQVTRIVETDTDAALSDFANLGALRKRGEGTLVLAAPALDGCGEVIVEEGAVAIDLDAATAASALPDTLQSKIALWLDASTNVLADGNGKVTHWFDCRETNPTASGDHSRPFASSSVQRVSGCQPGDGAPTRVENDPDMGGMTYLDFGPRSGTFAGGKWLCLDNTDGSNVGLQKMIEAFVVVAKHPNNAANRGLGTIFSGYYNGTRCFPFWYGTGNVLYSTTGNTRADRGATRFDRNPVWSGHVTIDDIGFHLVSTRLPIAQDTGSLQWNLIGADRDLGSGGMRIAEIIAFPARISEFDRMRVEEYLWRKWFGSRQTSVGTVRVNEGAGVAIDTTDNVAGDLKGGGAVVKTGAGVLRVPASDFAGTVELREGGVRTAGAAFAVPASGRLFTATAASVVSATATNAGIVAKNGYGPMTIASLPADTETLCVERGTLTLAPGGAGGATAVAAAAEFPHANFEAFADVSGWDNTYQYNNIGGGAGTATEKPTSCNWTFSRVGRSGNMLVGVQKNIVGSFANNYKVQGSLGIGYDGDISLSIAKGFAYATFTVPAAGLYKASFRLAGMSGRMDGQILVDGVQVVPFVALSTTSFLRYEAALPWLAAGEHTFTFSDNETDNNPRLLFDDVKILPVELCDTAPVSVAIANPSFELPWDNVADAINNGGYTPTSANCIGWTMPADSSDQLAGKSLRRRWYDGVTDLANGLGSNPDEMPDGFLCAQLYSSFSLSQSVTFPSAGRYRLRFQLARRQNFSPQVVVVSVGGTVVRKVVVRHDEFRPYEAVFDLAEGGAKTLLFEGTKEPSSANISVTAGCALLDAVTCERLSETVPANLVSNGGFENGMTGWTRDGYSNLVSAFVTANWADGIDRTPPQGADAFAFAIDGPPAALRQDVTFPAAGRYELSFRFQAFDAYPDLLTSVHRFWVKVGDNALLVRTLLADDAERLVTLPFTVAEAGTKTLEFGFERWINGGGCKANVLVDDVSIVAAPAADRTDLATYIPRTLAVSVLDTDVEPTALNLDFDGTAKVAAVRHNGRSIYGDITHELYPEWVMGRGRLRAEEPMFLLYLR